MSAWRSRPLGVHTFGLAAASVIVPFGQAAFVAIVIRGLPLPLANDVLWRFSLTIIVGIVADFGQRNTIFVDWQRARSCMERAIYLRVLLHYRFLGGVIALVLTSALLVVLDPRVGLPEALLWGTVAATNFTADLGISVLKGQCRGVTAALMALTDRLLMLLPLLVLWRTGTMTIFLIAAVLAASGAARSALAWSVSARGANPARVHGHRIGREALANVMRRNIPAGLSIGANVLYLRLGLVLLPGLGLSSLVAPMAVALPLREVGTTIGRVIAESSPARMLRSPDDAARRRGAAVLLLTALTGLASGIGLIIVGDAVSAVFGLLEFRNPAVQGLIGLLLAMMCIQTCLRLLLVAGGRGHFAAGAHLIGSAALAVLLTLMIPDSLAALLVTIAMIDAGVVALMLTFWARDRVRIEEESPAVLAID